MNVINISFIVLESNRESDHLLVGFSSACVCHYERLCVDVNNNQHAYTFFSYEDTMYMYPHLLYILFIYCTLIKHCLKLCVCFYQVAIPQVILKIVSMFVYIRYILYIFRHYFDLTND